MNFALRVINEKQLEYFMVFQNTCDDTVEMVKKQ